ncbi:hypothetical protein BJ508DRAFT_413090 [Ascobolus immersus RN42]|uniref:Uncharacterized protein n=1 Tax=Ascobolus immersus RN42 TaxID=1160509 RepID=A0A3N4IR76_ASCIM|nr:hypothetical protein BJ508DRAFT_413090 [Ascobolus immersus RN42]
MGLSNITYTGKTLHRLHRPPIRHLLSPSASRSASPPADRDIFSFQLQDSEGPTGPPGAGDLHSNHAHLPSPTSRYERERVQRSEAEHQTRTLLLHHIQEKLPQLDAVRSIDDVHLRPKLAQQLGYEWRCSGGYQLPSRSDGPTIKAIGYFSNGNHQQLRLALEEGKLRAVLAQMAEQTQDGMRRNKVGLARSDHDDGYDTSDDDTSDLTSLDEAGNPTNDDQEAPDSANEQYADSDLDSDYSLPRVLNLTKRKRHTNSKPAEPKPAPNLHSEKGRRTNLTKTALLQHIHATLPSIAHQITLHDILLTPEKTSAKGFLPYVWNLTGGYDFPKYGSGGRLKSLQHFSNAEHKALRKALDDGRLKASLRTKRRGRPPGRKPITPGKPNSNTRPSVSKPTPTSNSKESRTRTRGYTPAPSSLRSSASRSLRRNLAGRFTPYSRPTPPAQTTLQPDASTPPASTPSTNQPDTTDLINSLRTQLQTATEALATNTNRERVLFSALEKLAEPVSKEGLLFHKPIFFNGEFSPLVVSGRIGEETEGVKVVVFKFVYGSMVMESSMRLEKVR